MKNSYEADIKLLKATMEEERMKHKENEENLAKFAEEIPLLKDKLNWQKIAIEVLTHGK